MAALFSGPKIQQRAMPNAPTIADPAIAAARTASEQAAAATYGRAATDKTAGKAGSLLVAKKTLLGG